MRMLLWILAVLLILVFILWLGFQITPAAFSAPPVVAGPVETMPLPAGLPAPVARCMRSIYGDTLPIYKTIVMTGHARIRPAGPWYLPARTRFIHEVGTNYRHFIEITWFGLPILTVEEGYIDGASFFANALLGTEANAPKTNQGANLALWAEAMSFPAALVTDPRTHWAPLDDDSALLTVPFGAETETIVVRFDPTTHLIANMEAMRYQAKDSAAKTLWIPMTTHWGAGDDIFTGMEGAALWANQAGPWAYFTTDAIVHNGPVHDYIRARGM